MAVSHVMDTKAHICGAVTSTCRHTYIRRHARSEIENPVGLNRHYVEKVKV